MQPAVTLEYQRINSIIQSSRPLSINQSTSKIITKLGNSSWNDEMSQMSKYVNQLANQISRSSRDQLVKQVEIRPITLLSTRSINRLLNHSINQLYSQSSSQEFIQTFNHLINQSIIQLVNQPINYTINQSSNQSDNRSLSQELIQSIT